MVQFSHPGGNGVNNWNWDLDENKSSTQQSPQAAYQLFKAKNIRLIVTNGFCSDTSYQTINLDNYLKADFTVFEDNCPNEPVQFTSNSQGKIVQEEWLFGDGASSVASSPSHIYSQPFNTISYVVSYTVTDSFGCQNTAQKSIKVYSNCFIAVPTAFTPNHDGINDYLHPLNAIKASNLEFRIFNRWGQLVFKTNDWKTGWDGTINGKPQGSGTYVWFLHFTDRDSGKVREMKGTSVLIR
jgi:gliding motility-associated-like protein